MRAGEKVETVLDLFGLTDLWAKVHGSRNLINVVQALFVALASIKMPAELARDRRLRVTDLDGEYWRLLPPKHVYIPPPSRLPKGGGG